MKIKWSKIIKNNEGYVKLIPKNHEKNNISDKYDYPYPFF